jgi:transcriptional regulator with XRE-family HTH domain
MQSLKTAKTTETGYSVAPSANAKFADLTSNVGRDEYGNLLFELREAIAYEAKAQGLAKADLARILGVSRSRVTRVMDPTCDIKMSSLSDLATALKCKWIFRLKPNDAVRKRLSGSNRIGQPPTWHAERSKDVLQPKLSHEPNWSLVVASGGQ